MDPGGLLLEAPKLTAPGALDPLIDQTRRLWQMGDDIYRFAWELHYRDGTIRRQYERIGESVFQTWFKKIPKRGIQFIRVIDLGVPPPAKVLLDIPVPEDGEADILYNCTISMCGASLVGGTERIYTFGFRRPPPHLSEYWHLDPRQEPPGLLRNCDRIYGVR